MITLIHGENQIASRQRLTEDIDLAKKNKAEVIIKDGSKLSFEEARQILESSSFFGENRFSVWENFFSSAKNKEKEKILDYLKKNAVPINLIFWEDKTLKKIPEIKLDKIEAFKISSSLFQFLDSFTPDKKRNCLELLSILLKTEEPEMILFMLIRQIRLLLMAENQFYEDLLPWQKGKIISQAKKFKKAQLWQIYQNLLMIDYEQKTSVNLEPLAMRLELLVASL